MPVWHVDLLDNDMTEFTEIPVLDASCLQDGSDRSQLTADFAKAYGETGFGYIINHGIDQALIDAAFKASAEFHALPHKAKMAVELNHLHRGYIPINTSTDVNSKLADVKKPNQSASFMMMREDAAENPDAFLSGPNQWPDLEGFRDTLTAYHDALKGLAQNLMEVALAAANVTDTSVLKHFETPTTWLRLLHYPPQPAASPDDLYGSAPHTDFGCLTILAQDGVGGLQVQTPAGNWVDAPKIPGSFVVNVGDMLNRMSNGRLKSTPHRVINKSGKERYSCPFFFDPNVACDVAPLAGTGAPEFEAINFGDFLRGELQAGYDKHKTTTTDTFA